MSIGLAIALVGLTSLCLGLLLLPLLLRRGAAASRDAYNLAVYRDQLAEVERDVARGVLSGTEAEAARAEIGRRILALGPAGSNIVPHPKRVAAATVAILLLPITALLLYAQLGSPSQHDAPFAKRGGGTANPAADSAAHLDLPQAVAQIRDHLKTHPDDLAGWLLLARSEVSLGQYRDGVEAYRHAVDLSGHRADVVGDWGEAQVLAAGGTVTPAAQEAFAAGLNDPQTAPRARYYLALAKQQQGDAAGAIEAWRQLAADAPPDADWLPLVRQRMSEATATLGGAPPQGDGGAPPQGDGGMPSQAAVAAARQATAAASAEERRAMIGAMVERLAARLEQQPDDVDGWARLGHSYMVLEQPGKARDAYTRAVKLRPDDAALQQALAEAELAAHKAATTPGSGNGAK